MAPIEDTDEAMMTDREYMAKRMRRTLADVEMPPAQLEVKPNTPAIVDDVRCGWRAAPRMPFTFKTHSSTKTPTRPPSPRRGVSSFATCLSLSPRTSYKRSSPSSAPLKRQVGPSSSPAHASSPHDELS